MNIETATREDAESILQLQKRAYQSEAELYNDYSIPPLVQSIEDIMYSFVDTVFLKATIDGNIVGSVRAQQIGDTCSIGRLIVDPNLQGQGIGTQLMNEIEKRFSGATRFELFTGHKSERNIRLYERLGYMVFKTETVSDVLKLVFMEKWDSYLLKESGL